MRRHAKASSAGLTLGQGSRQGSIGRGACLLALLSALALAWASASASAATPDTYFPVGDFSGPGSGPGQVSAPARVAVDDASGQILVADRGNNRVQVFEPNGDSPSYLTEIGVDAPYGIAIDQANGDVYVSSAGAQAILKLNRVAGDPPTFSPDPAFTSPAVGGGPGEIENFAAALAVDPTNGDLLVADPSDNLVQRYDSSGAFIGSFDGSSSGSAFTAIEDLAVDLAGNVIVTDADTRAERYGPAGAFQASLGAPGAEPGRVAVDPHTGHVILLRHYGWNQSAVRAWVFDGSSELSSFAVPAPSSDPSALPLSIVGAAVDGGASKRLYLFTDLLFECCGSVSGYVFEPGASPAVTVEAPTAVTATGAHFSGTVNPNGMPTRWHFEYKDEASAAWINLPDAEAGSGESPVAATVDAALEAATDYQLRLVAKSPAGTTVSEPRPFTTPPGPPTATSHLVGSPTDTSARLTGYVDPGGPPTTYFFEYSTQADFSGATSVPAGENADAGSGSEPVLVSADISGLLPATAYYWRLRADNAEGEDASEPAAFTTMPGADTSPCPNAAIRQQQGSEMLGECRAWELVSADQDPGSVLGRGGAIAETGGRAILAFGGGGKDGGGLFPPSLFVRDKGGWQSRDLLPPSSTRPYVNYALTTFNADLSRFIAHSTPSLLGGVGPSAEVALEEGGQQTILSSLTQSSGPGVRFQVGDEALDTVLAAISTRIDPTHIANTSNVYDLGQEPPILVSRLPGGSAPSCGITTGTPTGFAPGASTSVENWISTDGRFAFFLTSGDDLDAPACDDPLRLYRRDLVSGTTTLISTPVVSGASSDSTFLQASADGSAVFFATSSALVADDTDSTGDVYRWSEEIGNACVTCVAKVSANVRPYPSFADSALASQDLTHLYFISSSALALGGVEGESNMYVWQVSEDSGPEGTITYVGPMSGTVVNQGASGGQLSPDGEILAFTARDGGLNALSGRDNGGHEQLYRYDDRDKSLICVSCPSDRPAESDLPEPFASVVSTSFGRIMSDDGARIVFPTEEALVSADVNHSLDIYEWHAGKVGLITEGATVPLAKQQSDLLAGMSADGRDVLFLSYSPLVDGAKDASSQAYDARIGGGFPLPSPPPAPCAGEGCREAPGVAPSQEIAASASFVGPPNPKVKRHRKKHRGRNHKRHSHRQAGKDRRVAR